MSVLAFLYIGASIMSLVSAGDTMLQNCSALCSSRKRSDESLKLKCGCGANNFAGSAVSADKGDKTTKHPDDPHLSLPIPPTSSISNMVIKVSGNIHLQPEVNKHGSEKKDETAKNPNHEATKQTTEKNSKTPPEDESLTDPPYYDTTAKYPGDDGTAQPYSAGGV
ncbi:hypothetical protein Bpfe_004591 [Biomphalaria pfeifferi]|uniref:Uncharacterized protein n=1 Tax=Biomphalaria pfeifferi TaxID=112525 RepID=A0AAD8FJU5_BIOPF|nr:hypothetical protein Bpfe_004591 [Biomphalaria pfeifferi]